MQNKSWVIKAFLFTFLSGVSGIDFSVSHKLLSIEKKASQSVTEPFSRMISNDFTSSENETSYSRPRNSENITSKMYLLSVSKEAGDFIKIFFSKIYSAKSSGGSLLSPSGSSTYFL